MCVIYKCLYIKYGFRGKDQIPEKYTSEIENIKNLNKKYAYKLWSEKTFYFDIINNEKLDKLFIKKVKETYEKFTLIHLKVDYMKYVILYLYGGIYIDVDVIAKKSFDALDPVLENHDCILERLNYSIFESYVTTSSPYALNNGIIVVKFPENKFLLKLIDNIQNYVFSHGDKFEGLKEKEFKSVLLINEVTGPKKITQVYNSLSNTEKNKIFITSTFFCSKSCRTDEDGLRIIEHYSDITWMKGKYMHIIELYTDPRKFTNMCLAIAAVVVCLSILIQNIYARAVLFVPIIFITILLIIKCM